MVSVFTHVGSLYARREESTVDTNVRFYSVLFHSVQFNLIRFDSILSTFGVFYFSEYNLTLRFLFLTCMTSGNDPTSRCTTHLINKWRVMSPHCGGVVWCHGSGQWSVVSGQWSVVIGPWSVDSRQSKVRTSKIATNTGTNNQPIWPIVYGNANMVSRSMTLDALKMVWANVAPSACAPLRMWRVVH